MENSPESKPSWFEIQRSSPQVRFEILGVSYVVNYMNCAVYTFPEKYEIFNHVYIDNPENPDGEGTYIFNTPDLLEGLQGYLFPNYMLPYPSEPDVEAYIKCEMQDLDGEIGNLD